MSKPWFSLAPAIAILALLSACASGGSEPLGPNEISFTTMGYSFKHPFQRAKLEENWSQLKIGMTAKEVADLGAFEALFLDQCVGFISFPLRQDG